MLVLCFQFVCAIWAKRRHVSSILIIVLGSVSLRGTRSKRNSFARMIMTRSHFWLLPNSEGRLRFFLREKGQVDRQPTGVGLVNFWMFPCSGWLPGSSASLLGFLLAHRARVPARFLQAQHQMDGWLGPAGCQLNFKNSLASLRKFFKRLTLCRCHWSYSQTLFPWLIS